MSKKSTQIALGGMFSAVSVALMFMTGLIPFATYAIPMLAGAMLIPVLVELGPKTAVMVYISVSLVSVFVVVDKEAAIMFIIFFGYYPILKQKIEKLHARILTYLVKVVHFNACIIAGFAIVYYVLRLEELIADMGDLGRYGPLVLLAAGNAIFVIYDIALTQYFGLYINWFKPRFLRR